MSNTAAALLGYVAWTLSLILLIEFLRVYLVLAKGYQAAAFKPDGSEISPFMHRLCRAHANCVENFPILGALLILALLTGNLVITESLAWYALAARIGQSLVHLASTRPLMANLRFALFMVQLIIAAIWVTAFAKLIFLR